jgi:uncharacterized RDD family membrane protein YckC
MQMPATYASLLRRFQALVIDALIGAAAFIVVAFAPELLGLSPTATRSLLVLLIAATSLYEPVLVSLRGGTIGHYRYGIRVVDAVSGHHLGLGRALLRLVLKLVLGGFSFLFMFVTRRAQSLHDLASRSVVIVADPAVASAIDAAVVLPLPPDADMPSALRRALVISGYSLGVLLGLGIVLGLSVSTGCLDADRCTPAEKASFRIAALLWLAATGLFLVSGWRGRLLGCRRRMTAPGHPPHDYPPRSEGSSE